MNAEFESFISDFQNGICCRAQEYLGSRLLDRGCLFRVWAPDASAVAVVGDFNSWDKNSNPMNNIGGGIWETEITAVSENSAYKYAITTSDGRLLWKADPYAYCAELRPASASLTSELSGFVWNDDKWLKYRRTHKVYNSALNVYEVHLGSWKRHTDGSFFTYREAADELVPYVKAMGFTHIELMPLTEHPYDGSWGYQCTGYFAATSRYGSPKDLMYLIDKFHGAGIGVIMDWVPAHFPKDPHGLVEFDGSRLYEDADPQMAEHPSWGTRIFDYSKGEVRSFLISSALFWLEKYHIDALRVDAVASMLYLDYDRRGKYWRPNKLGGRENLGAVEFLRNLNSVCFSYDDSIMMIAEESTAWPMVTAPADTGGLGFNLKWNMGWMNDSLRYLGTDPIHRAGAHNDLTFPLMYAFSENFILPLSHDEVVHMKGSLVNKAPGTREQKLASLRAYRAYMLAHPGKKLIFMGAELGQESEWDYDGELPWEILRYPDKAAAHEYFKETNSFYRSCRPLWNIDFSPEGFKWICPDESDKNIIAFIRRDKHGNEVTFVCNFSGTEVRDFRLGVTGTGIYRVVMSTDESRFGGSGALTDKQSYIVDKEPHHGKKYSILMDMPPLTAVFLKRHYKSSPQSVLRIK
ncbi:MAG: 1,4-alpha-glucan branching protein GlgB [Clostridiales bacterium]|nr:1,4-alpha-glucan branching protein GlgB [Clostridiales bacterium]